MSLTYAYELFDAGNERVGDGTFTSAKKNKKIAALCDLYADYWEERTLIVILVKVFDATRRDVTDERNVRLSLSWDVRTLSRDKCRVAWREDANVLEILSTDATPFA